MFVCLCLRAVTCGPGRELGGGAGFSPGAGVPCPDSSPRNPAIRSVAISPWMCAPSLEDFRCDFAIFLLPRGQHLTMENSSDSDKRGMMSLKGSVSRS